jgi:hypothetical protein
MARKARWHPPAKTTSILPDHLYNRCPAFCMVVSLDANTHLHFRGLTIAGCHLLLPRTARTTRSGLRVHPVRKRKYVESYTGPLP